MEYNKLIYKINKYKFYLKKADDTKKELYQNKLDFYYKQLNELINNNNLFNKNIIFNNII
jgi:hypothetical protein